MFLSVKLRPALDAAHRQFLSRVCCNRDYLNSWEKSDSAAKVSKKSLETKFQRNQRELILLGQFSFRNLLDCIRKFVNFESLRFTNLDPILFAFARFFSVRVWETRTIYIYFWKTLIQEKKVASTTFWKFWQILNFSNKMLLVLGFWLVVDMYIGYWHVNLDPNSDSGNVVETQQ